LIKNFKLKIKNFLNYLAQPARRKNKSLLKIINLAQPARRKNKSLLKIINLKINIWIKN